MPTFFKTTKPEELIRIEKKIQEHGFESLLAAEFEIAFQNRHFLSQEAQHDFIAASRKKYWWQVDMVQKNWHGQVSFTSDGFFDFLFHQHTEFIENPIDHHALYDAFIEATRTLLEKESKNDTRFTKVDVELRDCFMQKLRAALSDPNGTDYPYTQLCEQICFTVFDRRPHSVIGANAAECLQQITEQLKTYVRENVSYDQARQNHISNTLKKITEADKPQQTPALSVNASAIERDQLQRCLEDINDDFCKNTERMWKERKDGSDQLKFQNVTLAKKQESTPAKNNNSVITTPLQATLTIDDNKTETVDIKLQVTINLNQTIAIQCDTQSELIDEKMKFQLYAARFLNVLKNANALEEPPKVGIIALPDTECGGEKKVCAQFEVENGECEITDREANLIQAHFDAGFKIVVYGTLILTQRNASLSDEADACSLKP